MKEITDTYTFIQQPMVYVNGREGFFRAIFQSVSEYKKRKIVFSCFEIHIPFPENHMI